MTLIPPDLSATPEEIRAEVRRLVTDAVIHPYPLPAVGSAAWWSAPDSVRLATILVLGEAYVTFSPADAAMASIRDVSLAVSTGMDWSAGAHRMIFESPGKLAARRAIAVTPLRCGRLGCPVVVSVEHPLPADWGAVHCPRHAGDATA